MNLSPMPRLWLAALLGGLLWLGGVAAAEAAGEMKLEAQLIWGTNDEKSPDPSHKPVQPNVAKRLSALPFKWKNYFLVTSKDFKVKQGDTAKVIMSRECQIKVRNVDGDVVELQLFGKGKPVGKITKELAKGKCLVTGGDAENFTAWFVFLRQVE